MAKCRDCRWRVRKPSPYMCDVLMVGEIPENESDKERDCVDFEQAPKLLVDELAEAAKNLALSISMDMVNLAVDCAWTKDEADAVVEAWKVVRKLMGRYQKKVGDD